jgi:hypothetical protein
MDDTTKFLFGPLMALIPIFVWELEVKPRRTQRNVALVLLAEVEANLEEIAYYRLAREKDPEAYLANLALLSITYSSVHPSIAYLPIDCVTNLMRFYTVIRKIDTTNLALEATRARLFVTVDPEERKMLEASLSHELLSLGRQLNHAWSLGTSTQHDLRRAMEDSWLDQAPKNTDTVEIVKRANERYAASQAEKVLRSDLATSGMGHP